jgi:undecaprenyl pyrophosphate synthase
MVEAFEWCLELGVQHISVYAFSIDNFKRSCGEVGDLMHLAERKYTDLLQVRVPGCCCGRRQQKGAALQQAGCQNRTAVSSPRPTPPLLA